MIDLNEALSHYHETCAANKTLEDNLAKGKELELALQKLIRALGGSTNDLPKKEEKIQLKEVDTSSKAAIIRSLIPEGKEPFSAEKLLQIAIFHNSEITKKDVTFTLWRMEKDKVIKTLERGSKSKEGTYVRV